MRNRSAVQVFAYGSLLNVHSLRSTIQGAPLSACYPGVVNGWRRTFDVGFPNDGSQPDKSYIAADGTRPPRILMANITPVDAGICNGIVIPVHTDDLQALRQREARYSPTEIEVRIGSDVHRCVTFIGKQEFLSSSSPHLGDVHGGVVAASYYQTIMRGVRWWNRRYRGFQQQFQRSTDLPAPRLLADLTRIDHR